VDYTILQITCHLVVIQYKGCKQAGAHWRCTPNFCIKHYPGAMILLNTVFQVLSGQYFLAPQFWCRLLCSQQFVTNSTFLAL